MYKIFTIVYGLVCLAGGAFGAGYYIENKPPVRTAGWLLLECNDILGAGFVYSNGQVVTVDASARGDYENANRLLAEFMKLPKSKQYVMRTCQSTATKF